MTPFSFLSTIRRLPRLSLSLLAGLAILIWFVGGSNAAAPDAASISVSKSLSSPLDGTAALGEQVTFTIGLTNNGTTTLDTLPLRDETSFTCLQFQSAAPAPDRVDPFNQRIVWDDLTRVTGNLTPGASTSVTVTFIVIDDCGQAANTATVEGATDIIGGVAPTASSTASVIAISGLTVEKTLISPTPIAVDDPVVFELVVRNDSQQLFRDVLLEDTFDPNVLTFISATPPPDVVNPGNLAWLVGDLAVGEEFRVQATFEADASTIPGFSANVATANADDKNGVPVAPSSATVLFQVTAPGVEVSKTDSLAIDSDGNGRPSPGDTIQYTVDIVNTGNVSLTNVTFTDFAPRNTSLVVGSVTTTQGTVTSGNTPGDDEVRVTLGTMPSGDSETVTFRVRINNPVPAGVTQVTNQGFVSSTQRPSEPTDDPDTPTSDDPTITPITANPQVEAYKVASLQNDADGNGRPSPGDTLLYTVQIINQGNTAATGVTFSDIPDANGSLVVGSVSTSQGAVTSGNGAGRDERGRDRRHPGRQWRQRYHQLQRSCQLAPALRGGHAGQPGDRDGRQLSDGAHRRPHHPAGRRLDHGAPDAQPLHRGLQAGPAGD